MGLASIITNAVKTLKDVTSTLQIEISHEVFDGDDANGNRTYKSATKYKVIIEHRQRFVTAPDRTQQLSKSAIQFLQPVTVKTEDRITLPGGDIPQILDVQGVLNPDGTPYATLVLF